MDEDPYGPQIEEFMKKPMRYRLSTLMKASRIGVPPADVSWLSGAMPDALLHRIHIEETEKLVKSTDRLDCLTKVLIGLTVALVFLTGALLWMTYRASLH